MLQTSLVAWKTVMPRRWEEVKYKNSVCQRLSLRARALLLVFEKFTCAYLFQIALEIM